MRVVTSALPIEAGHAWQVLLVLSILSMTIGNVCALWQKNLRRMLAYSSIAHSGYMLIGLTVAQAGAAPAGRTHIRRRVGPGVLPGRVHVRLARLVRRAGRHGRTERGEVSSVDELAGAGRSQPLAAAAMAIFMFSLAGIPPLAGFWGKFALFSSAINLATHTSGAASAWLIGLAVIGALNAAVAAAYYLRVVGVMYFQSGPATSRPELQPGGALAATLACAAITIAAGIGPSYLMRATLEADDDVGRVLRTAAITEQTVPQLAATRSGVDR